MIANVDADSDFKPKGFIAELNEEVAELCRAKDKEYVLHFSVGYKRLDSSMDTVYDFVKKADECLYRIKNAREQIIEIV